MAEPTGEAFFPELSGLRADAAFLSGKLQAAEAAAAEASGKDPSEQVRVVLAALGRVSAVEISPRWQSRISAGGLGGAVLAAYQEAGSRRLETWAAEIGRTETTIPGYEQSPPPSDGSSDQSSPESVRRLWYLLQDATDRLDEVVQQAAARSQATVEGRDPGGHVTAAVSGGGELTGLTVQEEWATGVDERELGLAFTAAISNGYAIVDELARAATSQWPFPELDRLSGSPAALLATLGLPAAGSDDDRRGE